MKIWFVDDDDEMGQAIGLMLGLLDHEMRRFNNPRIAAKSLSQGEKPDLLLLDINMPEVNGIDLLEFIRRQPKWKDLPILMISSEATDQQIAGSPAELRSSEAPWGRTLPTGYVNR